MSGYKQPRRLNAVTGAFLLALLAGAYWMWRFFPAYFDSWTVDHILKESATKIYKANRLSEPTRTQTLREVIDKARLDMVKTAHVTDPELEVNLEIEDVAATISADYRVVVTHPILAKTTILHFVKKETANIKAVTWE